MSKTLFQLVGVDGENIGLYEVPTNLDADIQEIFNEAFDSVDADEDDFLDLVEEYLEGFRIKRTWVEEIHTDKL